MATMEESSDRLKNFKISKEEVNQLKEALKHEEFRNLLVEYSQELKDPNNRARYESEIVQCERERGCDVEFLEPCGTYVLKTWDASGGKVMINICTASKAGKPMSLPYDKSKGGHEWSIPYIVGCSRQEIDRKKQLCNVIDIIFNPNTIQIANETPAFKKLVHDTALDATESFLKLQLKRDQLKFPKLVYKGTVQKCLIRTMAKETPTFEFVHQENSMGVKTALILKIKLPLLSSTENCTLDVTDEMLHLDHEKYNLTINFPFKVDSNRGKATFDNFSKNLVVNLPTFKSSQHLISVPLANNALNFKIQEMDVNTSVNDMQSMTLDNDSELADSSDSDNCKNMSNNEKTTQSQQNINDMKEGTPDIDNVFNEESVSSEVFTENNEMDQKDVTTETDPKNNKKPLDNKTSNNNYWTENCENNSSSLNKNQKKAHLRQQALKTRSFSESSDDWSVSNSRSHSPSKGILKSSFFSMSSDICQSLERTTSLCEEGEEETVCSSSANIGSSSVKKSVSFSDVISKQLFRADSSILGQRKKNQRRAHNKRKNKRSNSEGEDVSSEPETAPANKSNDAQMIGSGKTTESTSDLMFDIDM